jgi:hypothetical protein
VLPRADGLPEPQAAALGVALGLRAALEAPDPFLVSLAVLTLLCDAGRPVLCLVDPRCSLVQAHDVAVRAEHGLIHAIPRLAAAVVHADPLDDTDHHALLADHTHA